MNSPPANDAAYQDSIFDRVVLSRAVDVDAMLADRSLSVDPFKARPSAFGRLGLMGADHGRRTLILMDDPEHARMRRLITQAFSARAVEAQRPRIEIIAADLLDAIDPCDAFDLVTAYAMPLPILVIAGMLGIDDVRIPQFKRWSEEIFLIFSPQRTEEENRILGAAFANLNDCLANAIAERRKHPRDDLISRLIAAQIDGDQLTDTQIVDTCRMLLVAGNVTTTDLIGNGVVALLRHTNQLDRLRADPTLWPAAVEEVLRHDPPVVAWNRQVLDDRRIGGCPVEAGQTVTAMLLAANHDPALHDDPHRFDIGRTGQKHFTFGGGAHFCLGASLARLEAHIALRMVFERFPRLRLAAEHLLQSKVQACFNGYEAVWLNVA